MRRNTNHTTWLMDDMSVDAATVYTSVRPRVTARRVRCSFHKRRIIAGLETKHSCAIKCVQAKHNIVCAPTHALPVLVLHNADDSLSTPVVDVLEAKWVLTGVVLIVATSRAVVLW